MFALRQSCNCDVVSSAEKAKPRGRRQNSLFLRSAGWMHKQLQQLLVVVMHEGKSNKKKEQQQTSIIDVAVVVVVANSSADQLV